MLPDLRMQTNENPANNRPTNPLRQRGKNAPKGGACDLRPIAGKSGLSIEGGPRQARFVPCKKWARLRSATCGQENEDVEQPEASKPTQPKGIGDWSRVSDSFCFALIGIKAHPAERHWRRSSSTSSIISSTSGIKAHPAERHWRPEAVQWDQHGAMLASKPTQPKGIGDTRLGFSAIRRARSGIKAHPAERHWRLQGHQMALIL